MIKLLDWINCPSDLSMEDIFETLSNANKPGARVSFISTEELEHIFKINNLDPSVRGIKIDEGMVLVWEGNGGIQDIIVELIRDIFGT